MSWRISKIVGMTFACLVAAIVAWVAIASQFTSTSMSYTLPTGRSVMTKADSWYMGMETSDDTATIRTAWHTIVVAPSELSVDGEALATIDKSVIRVDVTVCDGEVLFVADGKEVAHFRR